MSIADAIRYALYLIVILFTTNHWIIATTLLSIIELLWKWEYKLMVKDFERSLMEKYYDEARKKRDDIAKGNQNSRTE